MLGGCPVVAHPESRRRLLEPLDHCGEELFAYRDRPLPRVRVGARVQPHEVVSGILPRVLVVAVRGVEDDAPQLVHPGKVMVADAKVVDRLAVNEQSSGHARGLRAEI